jgi:hypothetical protein
LRRQRIKKKHPTARIQIRITNPRIGSAMIKARRLEPELGFAEGEIRSTVDWGSNDSLKTRLGLIGKALLVGVRK